MEPEQEMLPQARPRTGAHADRQIHLVPHEIDDFGGSLQPHRQLRTLDLEGTEPGRQPVGGEGLGGADGEHAFVFAHHALERVRHAVEGVGEERRDAASGVG